MKRLIPVTLGISLTAAMVVVLFNTEDVVMSSVLAVRASMVAVIIGLSLALGAGAADGVLATNPKVRVLVDSLPENSRFILACHRISALAAGVLVGLACGCFVALAVAWSNGSNPSLLALVQFPVAWLCVSSFASLGWIIGAFAKSWFAPPVLAVFPFAALVGNVLNSRNFIVVFEGTGPSTIFEIPAADIYAISTVVFIAVSMLAFALVFCWAGRRSFRGKIAVALATVILLGSIVALNAIHETTQLFTPLDSSSWPCAKLTGYEVQVCLPPDQERDLVAIAADLPRYQQRILQVDPSLGNRNWSPAYDSVESTLLYDLPIGNPPNEITQDPAIVSGLSPTRCFMADEIPNELLQATETLRSWIEPWVVSEYRPTYEVTLDEARDAYFVLRNCK